MVWAVNEHARFERQPRGARRARRRGLSKTVSRVERSAEYRRSLDELHQLASSFRHGLDGAQREQWLLLEEALLAHSERFSRAYYRAGFRCGVEWSARSRGARSEVQRPALSVEELFVEELFVDELAIRELALKVSPVRESSAGDARRASSPSGAANTVRMEAQAAVTAGAECLAALARLLLSLAKR